MLVPAQGGWESLEWPKRVETLDLSTSKYGKSFRDVGIEIIWTFRLNCKFQKLKDTFGSPSPKLELEWVPAPTRWPIRTEKLAGNKPNTRYYLGPNLGKPHKLF